ncbi:unnamed protein product [Lathyrus oleraceus]
MTNNIKSLYFTFAIICIASIVVSSSGGSNKNDEVFCTDWWGCPDDKHKCFFLCSNFGYGLHGKCHGSTCCCDGEAS